MQRCTKYVCINIICNLKSAMSTKVQPGAETHQHVSSLFTNAK